MTRRRSARKRNSKPSPLAGCLGLLLLVALSIGAIHSRTSPDPPSSNPSGETTDPIAPTTTGTPAPTPVAGSLSGGASEPQVAAAPAR
jgi:hypothetical protein